MDPYSGNHILLFSQEEMRCSFWGAIEMIAGIAFSFNDYKSV